MLISAQHGSNVITNPSVEVNTHWLVEVRRYCQHDSELHRGHVVLMAPKSLAVTTNATANAGVNPIPNSSPSTAYCSSVMVKSSSTGTAVWGYVADGSTETTYVTGTINQWQDGTI